MASHESSGRADEGTPSPQGGDDPWVAFGYLVAGVAFYGFLGWGLGVWLNADYLIPLGILVGAGFGLYLVFNRFGRIPQDDPVARSKPAAAPVDPDSARTNTPISTDQDISTEADATRPDEQ